MLPIKTYFKSSAHKAVKLLQLSRKCAYPKTWQYIVQHINCRKILKYSHSV